MGFFSFMGNLIIILICSGGVATALRLFYKAYMAKLKKEEAISKIETKADVRIAKQQRKETVDSARADATGTIVTGVIAGVTTAHVAKTAAETVKEIANTPKENQNVGELIPLSAKEQLRKQLG